MNHFNSQSRLAVVLIAAGNSSRLGTSKQLIEFKGQQLLAKAIELAKKVSQNFICVLGFNAETIIKQLNIDNKQCIKNELWKVGMGSSIAKGVEFQCSQLELETIDAILIMLCDQYLIEHGDLNLLVEEWCKNKDKIVASEYLDAKTEKNIVGAPAIFPFQYFSELKQLTSKGARGILTKNSANLISVSIPHAGTDLDTKQDLEQLYKYNKQSMENNND